MSIRSDEELDIILENEELAELHKQYYDYKITRAEYVAKEKAVYEKLNIRYVGDDERPTNFERLSKLKQMYTDNEINLESYNKHKNRILKDIEEEA
jgi:hypothetical protein